MWLQELFRNHDDPVDVVQDVTKEIFPLVFRKMEMEKMDQIMEIMEKIIQMGRREMDQMGKMEMLDERIRVVPITIRKLVLDHQIQQKQAYLHHLKKQDIRQRISHLQQKILSGHHSGNLMISMLCISTFSDDLEAMKNPSKPCFEIQKH